MTLHSRLADIASTFPQQEHVEIELERSRSGMLLDKSGFDIHGFPQSKLETEHGVWHGRRYEDDAVSLCNTSL